ncbi:uncharacterized protein LOC131309472 [Rhododendron vialii]|uniref:uncharacterized protein LOC131309472 n=1 Tax=Rhododendron vialii TaxID=182163 RepID=UPI00265DC27E|nr:uncharacterized protein LOC131309472 [Rhododendron vialii]
MEPPRSKKDVRSFLGKVQFISRFIAKLTLICEPIFRLLKKGVPLKWDDKCQIAFEAIRTYLQNPPEGDDGVERAVYYLSKKMVRFKEHYTPLEKTCWALVWASKKLRHYMLAYPVRKSVKGRAVAEFLADCPVEGGEDVEFKFPDEDIMTLAEDVWKLYFDGAANQKGFGIGVLLIAPDGSHIPLVFKLNFEVTNNQAEEIGSGGRFQPGSVTGNGDWKVKEEKLKPYHQDLEDLIPHFNKVTFTHVLRLKKQFADALATLASMVEIPIGVKLRPIVIEQRDTRVYQHVMAVDEPDDGHPWYYDIWRFMERGKYPIEASKKDKIALQMMAAQYIICGGNLYRRSHCGMHKLCIHGAETRRVMEEIHEGVCGPHMNSMMLARKILMQGYFWSTMETECVEYVRRCQKC